MLAAAMSLELWGGLLSLWLPFPSLKATGLVTAPSGRILYSCRMSCTSFSEHWVSVTVELKEMPPPFLGCRKRWGGSC